MAFRTKQTSNLYTLLLTSAVLALPIVATLNIDCNGKAFYCVNSTHFKICVDLGGGVSKTVDDFLIPCPQNTVCNINNYFECEYQAATTLASTIPQSDVTKEQTILDEKVTPRWEVLDVVTLFPIGREGENELSENYFNTISTTINSKLSNELSSTVVNIGVTATTESASVNNISVNDMKIMSESDLKNLAPNISDYSEFQVTETTTKSNELIVTTTAEELSDRTIGIENEGLSTNIIHHRSATEGTNLPVTVTNPYLNFTNEPTESASINNLSVNDTKVTSERDLKNQVPNISDYSELEATETTTKSNKLIVTTTAERLSDRTISIENERLSTNIIRHRSATDGTNLPVTVTNPYLNFTNEPTESAGINNLSVNDTKVTSESDLKNLVPNIGDYSEYQATETTTKSNELIVATTAEGLTDRTIGIENERLPTNIIHYRPATEGTNLPVTVTNPYLNFTNEPSTVNQNDNASNLLINFDYSSDVTILLPSENLEKPTTDVSNLDNFDENLNAHEQDIIYASISPINQQTTVNDKEDSLSDNAHTVRSLDGTHVEFTKSTDTLQEMGIEEIHLNDSKLHVDKVMQSVTDAIVTSLIPQNMLSITEDQEKTTTTDVSNVDNFNENFNIHGQDTTYVSVSPINPLTTIDNKAESFSDNAQTAQPSDITHVIFTGSSDTLQVKRAEEVHLDYSKQNVDKVIQPVTDPIVTSLNPKNILSNTEDDFLSFSQSILTSGISYVTLNEGLSTEKIQKTTTEKATFHYTDSSTISPAVSISQSNYLQLIKPADLTYVSLNDSLSIDNLDEITTEETNLHYFRKNDHIATTTESVPNSSQSSQTTDITYVTLNNGLSVDNIDKITTVENDLYLDYINTVTDSPKTSLSPATLNNKEKHAFNPSLPILHSDATHNISNKVDNLYKTTTANITTSNSTEHSVISDTIYPILNEDVSTDTYNRTTKDINLDYLKENYTEVATHASVSLKSTSPLTTVKNEENVTDSLSSDSSIVTLNETTTHEYNLNDILKNLNNYTQTATHSSVSFNSKVLSATTNTEENMPLQSTDTFVILNEGLSTSDSHKSTMEENNLDSIENIESNLDMVSITKINSLHIVHNKNENMSKLSNGVQFPDASTVDLNFDQSTKTLYKTTTDTNTDYSIKDNLSSYMEATVHESISPNTINNNKKHMSHSDAHTGILNEDLSTITSYKTTIRENNLNNFKDNFYTITETATDTSVPSLSKVSNIGQRTNLTDSVYLSEVTRLGIKEDQHTNTTQETITERTSSMHASLTNLSLLNPSSDIELLNRLNAKQTNEEKKLLNSSRVDEIRNNLYDGKLQIPIIPSITNPTELSEKRLININKDRNTVNDLTTYRPISKIMVNGIKEFNSTNENLNLPTLKEASTNIAESTIRASIGIDNSYITADKYGSSLYMHENISSTAISEFKELPAKLSNLHVVHKPYHQLNAVLASHTTSSDIKLETNPNELLVHLTKTEENDNITNPIKVLKNNVNVQRKENKEKLNLSMNTPNDDVFSTDSTFLNTYTDNSVQFSDVSQLKILSETDLTMNTLNTNNNNKNQESQITELISSKIEKPINYERQSVTNSLKDIDKPLGNIYSTEYSEKGIDVIQERTQFSTTPIPAIEKNKMGNAIFNNNLSKVADININSNMEQIKDNGFVDLYPETFTRSTNIENKLITDILSSSYTKDFKQAFVHIHLNNLTTVTGQNFTKDTTTYELQNHKIQQQIPSKNQTFDIIRTKSYSQINNEEFVNKISLGTATPITITQHPPNETSDAINSNTYYSHSKISDVNKTALKYIPVKMVALNSTVSSLEVSETNILKYELSCKNRKRGKYSDINNCTIFYICIGKDKPIVGKCPEKTVFSEINKQCTKNVSHCVRNNQFKCLSSGRYIDIYSKINYYVCVKKNDSFIRFKLQCQKGYYVNKTSTRCTLNVLNTSLSDEYDSNNTRERSSSYEQKSKEILNNFKCEKEGKFEFVEDCRKYYICKKKSREFRRKIKKCDSDEVFHKEKRKCVDIDSYECN